jgi:hypothetical protein
MTGTERQATLSLLARVARRLQEVMMVLNMAINDKSAAVHDELDQNTVSN